MTLDLKPLFQGDSYSTGVGGYPLLVRVGRRGALPLVTFTRPRTTASLLAAPSAPYLAAMAIGLREAHGWSEVQINGYLSALPGVASPAQ